MLGIGFGEFVILAIVLLIAVGPQGMPKLMKAVGRGMREFRKASRELRNQVGIDELLRDDDWRDPLGLRRQPVNMPSAASRPEPKFTDADRRREFPPKGVDLQESKGPALATSEAEGESSESVSAPVPRNGSLKPTTAPPPPPPPRAPVTEDEKR